MTSLPTYLETYQFLALYPHIVRTPKNSIIRAPQEHTTVGLNTVVPLYKDPSDQQFPLCKDPWCCVPSGQIHCFSPLMRDHPSAKTGHVFSALWTVFVEGGHCTLHTCTHLNLLLHFE